ncbi:MAG: LysR family transcriptional regulator [Alphaproteobacteria bacterium]|nr:MAG: LysR family transcriptional regulator [Alphaproteobacteria bacterium]
MNTSSEKSNAALQSVTLRQLRALEAMARTGTLARAAEELGITPPAVHNQLKILGEIAGTAVVERGDGGTLQLTEAGEILRRAGRRMEIELDGALSEVRALTAGEAGQVRLGAVSTAKYFVPRLVAKLRGRFPGVELRLAFGNRAEAIAMLEERRVDLMIMGRPPRLPAVTARVLGPHPLGIIAPPDHPLARTKRISPMALGSETVLLREEGSGTRTAALSFLSAALPRRRLRALEMGSNETIKQAVIAGLGIAFISLHTVAQEAAAGWLSVLDVEGLPIRRNWYLAHRADTELRPAARRVWDEIIAMDGTFLPVIGASRAPA